MKPFRGGLEPILRCHHHRYWHDWWLCPITLLALSTSFAFL